VADASANFWNWLVDKSAAVDFFSCSQPAAPRKAQHSDPAMFMDRRNALFANPFWKYHGQI